MNPASANEPTDDSKDVTMGVLRVLTLEDPEAVATHGHVIEAHFPWIETDSRCIPDHPDGIPSAAEEAEAIPYVMDLAREMAEDVDALLISCALDPGVPELREELDIPVLGAGRSVAAAALTRGDRVGTIGLEGGTAPVLERILGDHHHASTVVRGANTTNFLTTAAGRDAIANAIDRLEAAGCDVVAPSCTGITTSGVLPDVASDTPLSVVDPVLSMAAMAYNSLQL